MLPRERVIAVIEHRKPDRIPVYGWVRANLDQAIAAAFGSLEAFEDHYEFDLAHLFGGPSPYPGDLLEKLKKEQGGQIEPKTVLGIPLSDPNNQDLYQNLLGQIEHHKFRRGRFVYVQTPGIFECLNGVFGIEPHLAYLLLYEDELRQVYQRQAAWNRAFANNCLDLGIDMIHVSDDWGAQNSLLFSPEVWWKLIYPYHEATCRLVQRRKGYLSLHSDGHISQIIDGVIRLGYQVVHPYQESAGMDLLEFKARYRNVFTVMGGLDVQTAIGFGRLDRLGAEIERVLGLFADGGLIYCTSHFVQNHCSIEELKWAYDTIYDRVRNLNRSTRAPCSKPILR